MIRAHWKLQQWLRIKMICHCSLLRILCSSRRNCLFWDKFFNAPSSKQKLALNAGNIKINKFKTKFLSNTQQMTQSQFNGNELAATLAEQKYSVGSDSVNLRKCQHFHFDLRWTNSMKPPDTFHTCVFSLCSRRLREIESYQMGAKLNG